MGNDYFSPTALFVMFRETMEAAVIIAVLIQFLNRVQLGHLKKQVWWGAGLGLLISIIIGVIFIIVFYTVDNNLFEGNNEKIFEAVINFIASVMITILAFGFLKFMNLEAKWKNKLSKVAESTLSGKVTYTFFLIAFTSVLREGIESCLFLAGVGVDTTWRAIPIAGVIGAILGLVLGYVMFFSLKPVQLKWFFYITTAILFFLAAGMMMKAWHELQETGALGNYPEEEEEEEESSSETSLSTTPLNGTYANGTVWFANADEAEHEHEEEEEPAWCNKPLWDICDCCNDEDTGFFELAKALVGYTCSPTWIHVFAYIGYWIVVLAIIAYKFNKGTLTTYDLKESEEEIAAQKAAALEAGNEARAGVPQSDRA